MVRFACNHCKFTEKARYTGKVFAPPIGWWEGRLRPWPQVSPGAVHACTEECKEALEKTGHGGLYWKHIARGVDRGRMRDA